MNNTISDVISEAMKVNMKGKTATQRIAGMMAMLLLISGFLLILDTRTTYAAEIYDEDILVNGNCVAGFEGWDLSGDTGPLICEQAYGLGLDSSPDPTDGDEWIFCYYPMGEGTVSMSQEVNLADYATSIANGTVRLQLSGYVARFMSASTNKIKLQLLDQNGILTG
ncbi:MAG: hypothetical protein ACOYIF_05850 [Acetivibrionales bacterium]|jgi:hypothetical protein